ncbi:MAG: hypothetical protein ABSH32_15705 [Bryobacteraceae bacterium]|jgi:hypothetical protein
MTQEDLEQIRRIVNHTVRDALSANNHVLLERLQEVGDHLDRAFARLREELGGRWGHVERRFD